MKERRAFLFCQQDRAILCRECDVPIHTTNEHTQKHNRFLLTGTKLSAISALYTSSPLTSGSDSASVPVSKSVSFRNSVSVFPTISNQLSASKNQTLTSKTTTAITTTKTSEEGGSTSSISEYLIETLPGWHVEDFLDSSTTPFGFCKVCINGSASYLLLLHCKRNLEEVVGFQFLELTKYTIVHFYH